MKKRSLFLTAIAVTSALLLNQPVEALADDDELDARLSLQAFLIEERVAKQEIAQLEASGGVYSSALYEPISALGRLQQQYEFHEDAIESFRRSQHLVHRLFGVYSDRQLETLDRLVQSYAALGDHSAFDVQLHFKYRVASRSFQPDDIRLIAAQLQLADWYRQSGRFRDALALYEKSAALLPATDIHGQVRILRSVALTRYLDDSCCATEVLADALAMLEASASEGGDERSGWEVAEAAFDVLDMATLENQRRGVSGLAGVKSKYLGFSKRKQVLKLMGYATRPGLQPHTLDTYIDFGERAADAPAIPTVGYPVAMCGTTFSALAPSTHRDVQMNVTMSVTEQGKPIDIEISGDAPLKLKRYLKRSLIAGKYRAATNETGEAVAGSLSFTQHFEAPKPSITSHSQVADWGRSLVAQACQIQGVQRI